MISRFFEPRDNGRKESIDAVCDEINSIFSILDMDVYLVGIKDPKTKMPLFRNESGVEFDINGLSSGEKQLLLGFYLLNL